jgi:hypothetical protein
MISLIGFTESLFSNIALIQLAQVSQYRVAESHLCGVVYGFSQPVKHFWHVTIFDLHFCPRQVWCKPVQMPRVLPWISESTWTAFFLIHLRANHAGMAAKVTAVKYAAVRLAS